jgi:poly-gamma-glutamate synthesis protein (capsule biosynthesis protein)
MQNLIQPHKRKKLFIVLGCCLALFAVGVGVWWFALRDQQEAATTNLSSTASGAVEKTNSSITVAAMGDMLAHDSIVAQAKTADGYDFLPYFTNIKQLYESNDAVFCNPETPAAGATLGISGYPTFNAPTEFVRDLRKTGCSVINLASNHMSDKGQPGIDATIDNWEAQKPLALAGANKTAEAQQQISYFTKNDIKVAFLAFADFSNSTPPHSYSVTLYHDTALVDSLLETARKNADVVLVSAHWGTEDSHTVNAFLIWSAVGLVSFFSFRIA